MISNDTICNDVALKIGPVMPLRRLDDLTKFWQHRCEFLTQIKNTQRIASLQDNTENRS